MPISNPEFDAVRRDHDRVRSMAGEVGRIVERVVLRAEEPAAQAVRLDGDPVTLWILADDEAGGRGSGRLGYDGGNREGDGHGSAWVRAIHHRDRIRYLSLVA